jgi:phage replication O-like protein O
MADVQLEHGHVRIANRLAEALLYAEFSGVQFKLMHALIRLTYGWRRKTVTLAHAELAAYIHVKASGNFRAALGELIAEGVVIQATKGVGGKVSTYAIEKDYVRWGKFSVSFERLERIYGERPSSDDDALVQGDVFRDQRPKEAVASDRNSRKLVTETVTSTAPKSLSGETCEGGNTVERQGKTEEQQKQHPATPVDPDEATMTAKLVERAPEVREALPIFMRDIAEWARRMSWLGTLHAAMDDPPHLSGAQLARAMTQYVIRTPNPDDRSGRHFHAFCVDVARPASARASPPAPGRPPARATDSAAKPYAAALSGDPDE